MADIKKDNTRKEGGLSHTRWRAQWIWSKGDPVPQNFYLYFRKTFTLKEKVISVPIHVTADSRYKLYVNGRFVGRGPVRSDQGWQYYDTYDLAPFLRAGENVVAAIVHQYGVPTHSYTLGRGGFLLQGEVQQRDGRLVRLDTDSTWRVLPSAAWDRDTPRVSPAIMWMEIYDARKEPVGWQRPGYNDSGWDKPVVLGLPPVDPWENLVPRDIPFLFEKEIFPTAILDLGIVEAAPPTGRLNLTDIFGSAEGQVAYLFAYLHSPTEQRVAVSVHGVVMAMPVRLWINGVPYFHKTLPGSPGQWLHEFPVQRGWNELLVKVITLGRRPWILDLALGAAAGQSYQPVQWYAERSKTSPVNRAWIAGPYGRPEEPAFETIYEVEKTVLDRSPGRPVKLPGKMVSLNFTQGKNVAVLMAMERHHSKSTPGLRDASKLLRSGDGSARVSTAKTSGDVYLTLDFGKEVTGYVRLRLKGVAGGIVDLGYSENLLNGHVDTLREGLSFGDRYIMRDGPQEWELFFWKGFRYLQLTFRHLSRPVEIGSVSLLFTSYPVQYRGKFESSDPLLNQIWNVGRWTLQLNMHDGYEDTPWREQGQWVGDAQVELLGNYMTFGDVMLGTKFLRQIAQGQSKEGALPAMYPAGLVVYPTRQPMPPEGGIPTFMCQWVSILLDHYRYTGLKELVSELYPNVVRLMNYFNRYLDPHGLLKNVPGFIFLDWMPDPELMGSFGSPMDSQRELTGLNSHYYRALLDAAELASIVGDRTRGAEWLRKAETVKRSINGRMWSEKRGVYIHGRIGKQMMPKVAVHDSVLVAYAGVAPPERVTRSLNALFRDPSSDAVQIGTPYFYFFYLQALRGAGMHHEALVAIRHAYGKMLQAGATTWWEHLSGHASLSHGWGAAPNFDLSAYVLGVKPTEPGFTAFRVEPQPADLKWAKGVVPTVRGDVEVEWKRETERFELRVNVPMKATVELSVPAVSLKATRFIGKKNAERSDFQRGRARYWVTGPGTFLVHSAILASNSEHGAKGQ
jgi:hypothetical protein